MLEGWEGSDYYLSLGESLGPKTIFTGDGEELLFLLEQRSVKYLEYPLWELEPEEMTRGTASGGCGWCWGRGRWIRPPRS